MSLKQKIKLLLYAFLMVFYTNVKAQTFSVSGPSEVQLGEQFEIRYTVEDGDFDDIKLPSFEGFKLVGGPNRSNQFYMVNGATSRKATLSYQFLAVQKGTLIVQAATAIIKGKSYKSSQLIIKVQGERPQPKNLDASKDLMVRAEIETKNNYFIGQQVVVKYKLYYNREVKMNQILDEDTYSEMMQQYIQLNGNEATTTMINGKQYNVATFKAISIYPQKVGKLTIKPMILQVGVAEGGDEDFGFFSSMNYTPVNLTSNSLTLDIKAWPSGAPSTFTGAVGKYSMSVYFNKNTVKPNGTATLQLSLEGNGYPRAINGPIQTFGDDIEVYEPKKIDGESGYRDNEIKHTTAFEYYVIPKKEGKFYINPKFTYLDPDSGTYITLDSPDNELIVNKQVEDNGGTDENAFVETISKSTKNPNANLYGLIGAFIFGIIGLGLWWIFRSKPSSKNEKSFAAKSTKVDSKDPKSFHKALAEKVYHQISVKYGVTPKDFNIPFITALLNNHGKKDAALLFEEIIQECDLAVYGGMITEQSMNTLQQKADLLIKQI